MSYPLEGLRVLDFGQGIAGPYCAQLLGDHGATVVKVEPPRGDWSRTMGAPEKNGMCGSFVSVNRNKLGMCLDMKHVQAREIAHELAVRADVVVESFRPGVMDRLGLSYDSLREQNPKLVYCDVTGFGRSGPNIAFPASDSVMQPFGGLMSINGERDGQPLRVGNVVSDMLAGANAFSGILLALLSRGATGKGKRVSVSLLDSIVAFQASPLSEYLLTGKVPVRLGNDHPMTTPSGVFATRDGAISLAVMDHKWTDFCAGIGAANLAEDLRFVTTGVRQKNRDALRTAMAPIFLDRTSADWIGKLRGLDILCAPINGYPDLVNDPQVVHNEIFSWISGAEAKQLPMVRNPVRLESEEPRFTPPPRLGEHTAQILAKELNYSPAQIDQAMAAGIACGAPR